MQFEIPTKMRRFRRTVCAIAGCLLAFPAVGRCALGGSLDSVQADGTALHAAVRTQLASSYSRNALTLPTGTTVTEYADGSGTVFAVTWTGPVPPNLGQLLGSYYAEYQGALAASKATAHRARVTQGEHVVVQTAGIMRALWGRAYLSGGIPAGITLAEIR